MSCHRLPFSLVAALAAAVAVAQQIQPPSAFPPDHMPKGPPSFSAIAYGPHARHRLDVHCPAGAGPFPVVVFFHSGAFVAGDKQHGLPNPLLDAVRGAGFALASANYRYVSTDPYPAPMQDGARVVQFLREQAGKFKLDPARMVVSGISAGGDIALWVALHDDMADPKSDDPVARQSTRVTAAAVFDVPTSLDHRVVREWLGGRIENHPSWVQLYGVKTIAELERPPVRQLAAAASPINLVSRGDPPVWLYYAAPRIGVPLAPDTAVGKFIHHPLFGEKLVGALRAVEVPVTMLTAQDQVEPGAELAKFLKATVAAGK